MESPNFIKSQDLDLLKQILQFATKKKIKLYIVGGYLRDIILRRDKPVTDIDFCLKKNAINFGSMLARRIGSGFVILDRDHGACRLVKRLKNKIYTLDFTDFRGRDLEDDLLHRDFTINSICVELDKFIAANKLDHLIIDPYRGRHDLRMKAIRVIGRRAFDEDPLRLLRAFSFSCLLGFKIDRMTLELIKAKKDKLSQVSFERIRDELFKIFDCPDSFRFIQKLDELRILRLIMPQIDVMRNIKQGPYHHLDVWRHSLETLRQLEIAIKEFKNNKNIQEYLDEVVSGERSRRSVIKLVALLHDIGKPRAKRREGGKIKFHGHERIGLEFIEAIVKRLRLSNDELSSLNTMVLWHLRPGYLADNKEITPRAKFRYFRDTGKEAVSILLISIADQRATKGRLTSKQSRVRHEQVAKRLINVFFQQRKEQRLPRVINGNDLIDRFKLEPSPLIGKILTEVEELQAIGKIGTKKHALAIAKEIILRNAGQKSNYRGKKQNIKSKI